IRGLRHGAIDDRADLRARAAGPWRRRPDVVNANDHRRYRHPEGARPLPGLYRRGLRLVLDWRPGARRRTDRASALVADLLDQPAARPDRARAHLQRAAADPAEPAPSRARPAGRRADDDGGDRADAGAVLGRGALCLAELAN